MATAKDTFTGTIIQAGCDADNDVTVTIQTTKEQLQQLRWLPLYLEIEVSLAPLDQPKAA